MSNKFLIGLKWFSIAIILIFLVALITSFISNKCVGQQIATAIGMVIGFTCMGNYMLET